MKQKINIAQRMWNIHLLDNDEEYGKLLERDIIKFANEKPVTKKDAKLWELPEMPYEHEIDIENYDDYKPFTPATYDCFFEPYEIWEI